MATILDLVQAAKTLEQSVATLIADFKAGQALSADQLTKQLEADTQSIATVIGIIEKVTSDLKAAIPAAPAQPAQ